MVGVGRVGRVGGGVNDDGWVGGPNQQPTVSGHT